jgi:hypothetical protein
MKTDLVTLSDGSVIPIEYDETKQTHVHVCNYPSEVCNICGESMTCSIPRILSGLSSL